MESRQELRQPHFSFASLFWLHFEVETKAQMGKWLDQGQQPIRSSTISGMGSPQCGGPRG